MASKDRDAIVEVFETMFEGADQCGIYPTSTAYSRLEAYVMQERQRAIGATHAACCLELDKGGDPRVVECSGFFEGIDKLLSQPLECY